MCGIVAYHSKNPKSWHLDLVSNIMVNSKIRGLHAYGMSYEREGKILSVKAHAQEELISRMGIQSFRDHPPRSFIAHNRYSTSGDWKDHSNNQPITIKKELDYSMVFNGVVDQGTPMEWEEKYGRHYSTDNDGEIVLREFLSRNLEDWQAWFRRQNFSFAGAFLVEREGLFIVRNANRPLWFASAEGASFYASTRDILKRSGAPGEYFQVPSGKVIRHN